MLHAQVVVRTDNGAPEQAPDALSGVAVHVAAHPFLLRVIDRLVARVLVADVYIYNIYV